MPGTAREAPGASTLTGCEATAHIRRRPEPSQNLTRILPAAHSIPPQAGRMAQLFIPMSYTIKTVQSLLLD